MNWRRFWSTFTLWGDDEESSNSQQADRAPLASEPCAEFGEAASQAETPIVMSTPELPFSQWLCSPQRSTRSRSPPRTPVVSELTARPRALFDKSGRPLRRLRRKTLPDCMLVSPGHALLSQQQTDQYFYEILPEDPLAVQCRQLTVNLNWLTEAEWGKLTQDEQRRYIQSKVRCFFMTHCRNIAWDDGVLSFREHSGKRNMTRVEAKSAYTLLSEEQRCAVANVCAKCSKAPPFLEEMVMTYVTTRKNKEKRQRVLGQNILLTYVGPWRVDLEELTALQKGASIESLCVALRGLERAQALWCRFKSHALALMRSLRACDYAVCMEVCPERYHSRGDIIPHLHVFLRSSVNMRVTVIAQLSIDGCSPNIGSAIGGLQQVGTRTRATWAGYFYCCVKKVGGVWSASTRRPFKDFSVQASWIMNLRQSGKIDEVTCRDLLAETGVGVSRCLVDMSKQVQLSEEQEATRLLAEAHSELSAKGQLPFHDYPEVTQFLEQFDTCQYRYKYLVITGPSRLGKTMFARTLAKAGWKALELNCCGGCEPDLRAYRLREHDCVIFDEISAFQVVKQKKLFQAGPATVALGCSTTNCHSYNVMVHRRKLVLCTNTWVSDLQHKDMTEDDASWLTENGILLNVTQPMFKTS